MQLINKYFLTTIFFIFSASAINLFIMQSAVANNKPIVENNIYNLFEENRKSFALNAMKPTACYNQCPIDSHSGIEIACWLDCMR